MIKRSFALTTIATVVALASMALLPIAQSFAFAADKKGSFRSHKNYKVSGTATVKSNGTITLSGFKTTSGPDLYVYVGNGAPSRLVAKLKRTSGSQSYKISSSVAKSITTVHIHCKRFNSVFGTANIK